MLYVGDFVLFTPSENIVVCEHKFDKAYAIIDCVNEKQTEVCLTTFDGRRFQAIKILGNIKKLFDNDINIVQESAIDFYNTNVFDIMKYGIIWYVFDDFKEYVENINSTKDRTTHSNFEELIYQICGIIELLKLQREENWTCHEIDLLKILKNYCLYFEKYLLKL